MSGMECSSVCDTGTGWPGPEFLDVRVRKTRKLRRCCECLCEIGVGERYEYVRGKWEGDWDTFRTCLTCARIRRDYGCSFGGLREELWDALGMDYVAGETD